MLKTSVLCFFASFGCAYACELVQLKWRSGLLKVISLLLAAAGLIAQTFYLLNRSSKTDLAPLLSSAHDWLLVLAWLIVLVYLFVSLVEWQLDTGVFVWPVVLAMVVAAQFVTASPNDAVDSLRGWKMLHAATLALGTFGVFSGFILSQLYLWQYWRLKRLLAAGNAAKLPNLERIQRLNRWSILIAVPLLTIGVISGFGLAILSKSASWTTVLSDPVVIGGAVTWTLMGAVFLWLLLHRGSPGRQVATLTVWSCGFLLITSVGLQVLVATIGAAGVHGAAPAVNAAPPPSQSPASQN